MSKIFVSYRREDTAGHAGRIYDRLTISFGKNNIFRDVDHIKYGEDFVEALQEAISSSKALIAIIGPDWAKIKDKHGNCRLENSYDFVRLEIESALKMGIPIFPVLVKNAEMPDPNELPQEISKISRFQALEISETRIDYDVGELIKILETKLNITIKKSDNSESIETDDYNLSNELEIERIPSSVKHRLKRMKVTNQLSFLDLFRKYKKSKINAYLLLVFPLPILGLHNSYLNNRTRHVIFFTVSAILIFFLLNLGRKEMVFYFFIGMLIWPVIDIFLIPTMLDKCNNDIALKILQEIEAD